MSGNLLRLLQGKGSMLSLLEATTESEALWGICSCSLGIYPLDFPFLPLSTLAGLAGPLWNPHTQSQRKKDISFANDQATCPHLALYSVSHTAPLTGSWSQGPVDGYSCIPEQRLQKGRAAGPRCPTPGLPWLEECGNSVITEL